MTSTSPSHLSPRFYYFPESLLSLRFSILLLLHGCATHDALNTLSHHKAGTPRPFEIKILRTMRKCFSTCARTLSHENPLVRTYIDPPHSPSLLHTLSQERHDSTLSNTILLFLDRVSPGPPDRDHLPPSPAPNAASPPNVPSPMSDTPSPCPRPRAAWASRRSPRTSRSPFRATASARVSSTPTSSGPRCPRCWG